ncbi:MAG: hypothetical protein M3256_07590 [Actinomycetota bacterium]|nr:hypothetical protein [Actinomycetota bacterium]
MVHEIAELGFGREAEAEAYERSRPSYPPEVVAGLMEHLRLRAGVTVVDLAAGTGKMTRLLAPGGARLVAAGVVDRIRGVTHVAALPADEQATILASVREVLAAHPQTRDDRELRIPYRVDCYWTERV